MHIVFLIKDFKSGILVNKDGMPSKSGAEVLVERHAQELIRQGHEVSVLARKRLWSTPIFERNECGTLLRLPQGLRLLLTLLFLVWNRKQIDVLYVFAQTPFIMFAIIIGRLLGIPAVYLSTIMGEAFEAGRKRRLYGRILGRCAAFIAISNEIRQEIIDHGYDPRRVHWIPQGLDTDYYHPATELEKRRLGATFGVPAGKTIVLFCSRLDHRKGFDLLLQVWPRMAQANPNLHLVVIGGGKYAEVEQMQQFVNTRNAKDVTYAGEVDDTALCMQCADIFFFPSRREGLANVLLEALACGCVPVCTDIGGNRDVVENGKTGYLFSLEEPSAAVAIVDTLSRQQDKLAELSKAAVRFAQEKLDVRVAVSQITEVFRQSGQRREP